LTDVGAYDTAMRYTSIRYEPVDDMFDSRLQNVPTVEPFIWNAMLFIPPPPRLLLENFLSYLNSLQKNPLTKH